MPLVLGPQSRGVRGRKALRLQPTEDLNDPRELRVKRLDNNHNEAWIMILRARTYALTVLALATCELAVVDLQAQARDPLNDIVGLWKAKRRFGPDARGPLLIQRNGMTYTGDMMGFTFPV